MSDTESQVDKRPRQSFRERLSCLIDNASKKVSNWQIGSFACPSEKDKFE